MEPSLTCFGNYFLKRRILIYISPRAPYDAAIGSNSLKNLI
jgi:hypothetical protein